MKPLNILDAHKDSRFNPEIDKKNNYITKSVLTVPVIDSEKGNVVGNTTKPKQYNMLFFKCK